jgi:GTP-binding protein HflX
VDASADDDELDRQVQAVDDVLTEIGAAELPRELVLNKIDLLDEIGRRRLANRFPGAPHVSAASGEGLDVLRARVAEHFGSRWELVRLLVPYDEGGRLSELYALGAPIEQREDTADGVLVVARLPRRDLHRFAPYLIAESRRETA